MENRLYRHKWPFLFAPDHPPTQEEHPACTVFARCDGCPYPAHGFICWRSDGSCLRKDMEQKIRQEASK